MIKRLKKLINKSFKPVITLSVLFSFTLSQIFIATPYVYASDLPEVLETVVEEEASEELGATEVEFEVGEVEVPEEENIEETTTESPETLEEKTQTGEVQTEDEENNSSVREEAKTWGEDNKKYTTTENVKLNETYKFPENEKVTVKFTKLGSDGKLSIKEINLSDEEVEELGALSSTAYDITSTMENGTFEYELTLPLPNNSDDVEVLYSENGADFEEVASETEQKNDIIKISGLDHFTVFVLVNNVTGDDATAGTDDDIANGTLVAIDDAWVNENNTTQNNGNDADLSIKSRLGENRRAYVTFNTASVPAGSTITNATLRLYMSDAPGASRTYEAYLVEDSWAENSVTWGAQPGVTGSATDSVVTGTSNNKWLEFDVTSDVNDFVNNSVTNYGWMIKDSAEDGGTPARTSTISSSEKGNELRRPQLVVDFSESADEPTVYNSPSSNLATTGGDDDGFETNPTGAYSDGGTFATNINGAGDKHIFGDYGFSIPTGSTINGIEVRADWYIDGDAGTNSLSVELSFDGGTTWTTAKTDITETTAEHIVSFGDSSDTWGRTWTAEELDDGDFLVRVTMNSTNANRDFYLDWIPVRVYYTEPIVGDTTAPANPTDVVSTSHTISAYSNIDTIDMEWTAAVDDVSGVDGYSYEFTTSSTTDPDETKDIEETELGVSSTALSEGSWYFHIRTVDNAGNWSATDHYGPYHIDLTDPATDPSDFSSDPSSFPTTDTTIEVSWTTQGTDAFSGVDGYSYLFSENSVDTPDETKDLEETDTSAISPELTSGIWYFHISTVDVAGNWTSTASYGPLTVDVDSPTVGGITITTDFDPYVRGNGAGFDIEALVSDLGAGIDTDSCEYTINGGTDWFAALHDLIDGKCYVDGINATNGQELDINIRVSDLAGNTTEGTELERKSDARRPSFNTMVADPESGGFTAGTTTIRATAEDTVSPITKCEIRIHDGSSFGSWMPATWTPDGDPKSGTCEYDLTGLTDGALYRFRMRITDSVGITRNRTIDRTIDALAPSVDAGTDKITNLEFTQDATASDAGVGIVSYLWEQVLGTGTIVFGTPNAEDTTISADLDGTYEIKLSVEDLFGYSGSDTFELVWDTTDPIDPTPTSSSHTTSTWSTDNTVDVEWSGASDALSGVDGFYTEWNTSPTSIVGPTVKEYEETDSSETSPALSDGDTHYFHIATLDNAGNWTSTAHLGPFYIDTTAPDTVLNAYSPDPSFDQTPTYTGTATDGTSFVAGVEFRVLHSGSLIVFQDWTAATAADGTFDSLVEDFLFTTLHLPTDPYVIQARSTDGAGNVDSTPAEDTLETVQEESDEDEPRNVFNNDETEGEVLGAAVSSVFSGLGGGFFSGNTTDGGDNDQVEGETLGTEISEEDLAEVFGTDIQEGEEKDFSWLWWIWVLLILLVLIFLYKLYKKK